MKTDTIRIGTRGSALALAQAHETRDRLIAAHGLPQDAFEIVVMSTAGDRVQDRPLAEIGGKGLFTAEIEEALLNGGIDLAVHSSKDMPTALPDGLYLSAFLEREDPRDAFIGRDAKTLMDLPHGATAGSSSLRRQALIRRARPDLNVVMYRGNVQTRLRKLAEGAVDATLLACAGLRRLGLIGEATDIMALDVFPPAPGQGAICIESRTGDTETDALLAPIHHAPTGHQLACERAFLAALDGSCRTPIAGLAGIDGTELLLTVLIARPDGSTVHRETGKAHVMDGVALGEALGRKLRERGGPDFFRD